MLYLELTHINASMGCQMGDVVITPAGTDDPGTLFRKLRSQYGRCARTLHIDTRWGSAPVGWVFESVRSYLDCPDEEYLCQIAVVLLEDDPVRNFGRREYRVLAA